MSKARGNRIRIANSLTLETNDKLEFYAYKLGLSKSAIVTMASLVNGNTNKDILKWFANHKPNTKWAGSLVWLGGVTWYTPHNSDNKYRKDK